MTKRKYEPTPGLIAAALGFPVSKGRLSKADAVMAELFETRHLAHWLAQCILFSCEHVGLANDNRMRKPRKNESDAEKELRVLAAKSFQVFAQLRSGRD